jgi:S1-C subfamily serine protease
MTAWYCATVRSYEGPDIRRDATVRAIEEVTPSVVNISTETIVEVRDPVEQLFRDFFGQNWSQPSQKSLGSGVIIDESGYVITNFHVVQRATHITVTLWDGREFEARPLVGTQKTDVALLKLVTRKNEKFKAIHFAADDDLLLGETVLALGNPFGLGPSVSRGILSSRSRRPPIQDQPLEREDWLQTDAAINPGNSGGPLVNLRAELIGLNVAVMRDAQGIGFAIPVKRVSEALADLFTPEAIKGFWLGAKFASSTNGLVTVFVEPGSPAEKAGFKTGDKVLKVNDRMPRNIIELNHDLIAAAGEREVPLVLSHGGERRNVSVRMIPEKDFFNESLVREKLGLTLKKLDETMAGRVGLDSDDGFVIMSVEAGSPADRAELQKGYIVRAVDDRPVDDIRDVAKALFPKKRGETVKLSLIVPRPRGRFVQLFSAAAEVKVR